MQCATRTRLCPIISSMFIFVDFIEFCGCSAMVVFQCP